MGRLRFRQLLIAVLTIGQVALLGCTGAQHENREEKGKLLLFSTGLGLMDCGIMSMQGNHRQIIKVPTGVGGYGWSLTGKSLLYIGNSGKLYVYDLGTKQSSTVSIEGRTVVSALLLPDDASLVVQWAGSRSADTAGMRWGIAIVDLPSRRVSWLTEGDGSSPYISVRRDGRAIALQDDYGVEVRELTDHHALSPPRVIAKKGGALAGGIAWSPDGAFLAALWRTGIVQISQNPLVGQSKRSLSVYREDGTQAWEIQAPNSILGSLAWHPNSRRLAIRSADLKAGKTSVYLVDLQEGKWRLSSPKVFKGILSLGGWSADGSAFTYSLSTNKDESRLYVASPDLEHARPISPKGSLDFDPEWQP